ncbi:hypothetical protein V5799_006778 [Amblyomma americanum]|uniref:AMP-dependent synthetase/ligase domain-containing protein n=1 Tax=Amblyomma americanum TaxID=6943 RepID=A0AAQ4DVF2_AMBAM
MESLRRFAAGLQRLGLGRGDRVYISVQSSIDAFIAMCAIACTGAAIVTGSGPEFEAEHMRNAGVTHILTDPVSVSTLPRNDQSLCIKVINTETGTVLGPMELGEVLVHSDTFMMLGYTQEPEETPAAFTDDGWFRTGE